MVGIVRAFILGVMERGSSFGMTYDKDPCSPRSVAYDNGRNFGEFISGLRERGKK